MGGRSISALLTSLQSVWLNQPPQASSDYLSVQLGCSAAQGNLCYVNNNHTCSNTSTPGERLLSSSEQVRVDPLQDGDRPPAHHLSAAKKHSRPSATAAATTKEAKVRALQQLRATSEYHKVHSKKKPEAVARCPKAPKKTPEEPKTSQAQAGRQLLTLKNLIDGYSAEATLPARRTKSRRDLRKHPQVKKRRRLNRSKNSLKEKHPRMMK